MAQRRTLTQEETDDIYQDSGVSVSQSGVGTSRDLDDVSGTFDPEMAAIAAENKAKAAKKGREGNLSYQQEFIRKNNKRLAAIEEEEQRIAQKERDEEKLWGKTVEQPDNSSAKSYKAVDRGSDGSDYYGDGFVDPQSEDVFDTDSTLDIKENTPIAEDKSPYNIQHSADDPSPDNLSASTSPDNLIAGEDNTYSAGLGPDDDNFVAVDLTDQQQVINKQKENSNDIRNAGDPSLWEDWRVKLVLPPDADYLYNSTNPGILFPLSKQGTDGLIFPYTPQIQIQHEANYENYDLIHSNHRGYFYKNSAVKSIIVTATFTAQDTLEANYMLAALHFLRSCTKMFYGQDEQRGMPPPVVKLRGLGEYQFNDHPCVITSMNFNLPNDVDYIAAGTPDTNPLGDGFIEAVERRASGHNSWSSKISRLIGAGLGFDDSPSGDITVKQPASNPEVPGAEVYAGKTYVPTKIDINFSMLPIQTRKQVSTEFSLRDYASGKLLKTGFW